MDHRSTYEPTASQFPGETQLTEDRPAEMSLVVALLGCKTSEACPQTPADSLTTIACPPSVAVSTLPTASQFPALVQLTPYKLLSCWSESGGSTISVAEPHWPPTSATAIASTYPLASLY